MVYGRHMFTTDMMSTQRSESMNNVLKKYLKPKHNMLYFFEHYTRLVEDRRYKELLAEFKMRDTSPMLKVNVEMLRDAPMIYTPQVFQMFQEEYIKALDCSIDKTNKTADHTEYKVKYSSKVTEHRVRFESSLQIVECSCMKFAFVGILCAHALKVLDKKNIKKIPEQYVSKRWIKDAKDGDLRSSVIAQESPERCIGKRYFNLNYNFREITTLAAETDTMYEHTNEIFSKLMKDLRDIKRGLSSGISTSSNTQEKEEEVLCSNQEHEGLFIAGVKAKATVGRPKGRMKGALERPKRCKVQAKPQSKKNKPSCSQHVESTVELQVQNNQDAMAHSHPSDQQ
ncbi:Protein FAR1-RELATED SEQUENCE 5 [Linum perenne]